MRTVATTLAAPRPSVRPLRLPRRARVRAMYVLNTLVSRLGFQVPEACPRAHVEYNTNNDGVSRTMLPPSPRMFTSSLSSS